MADRGRLKCPREAINRALSLIPNDELTQKELKSIVRTPMEGFGGVGMIHDGHGGWYSSGRFSANPNYEACMKECDELKMTSEYCPCDRFFKGKTKEK